MTSEPRKFHQHGRHVQKAHGRRSAALATDGSHLSGCMVALVPTVSDAKRLAIKGGELPADLHLTLAYLGPDAAAWDDHSRGELTGFLKSMVQSGDFGEWGIFTAKIFGAAHWNANTDSPSWVWSVGDLPGDDSMDLDGDALEDYHELVYEALESGHEHPDLPPPHSPWVAHICAAYTDDPSLLPELEKRLGTVTFDRIRVSFGDDDTDIPLNRDVGVAPVAASAGPLRRKPTDMEIASRADFGLQDARWHSAVDSVTGAWVSVLSGQRAQISGQITTAVDSGELDLLSTLHADTGRAYDVLTEHMRRFAQQCAEEQQREAERQGIKVGDWSLGPDSALAASAIGTALDRIRSFAKVTVAALADRLSSSSSRRAVVLSQTETDGGSVARAVDREVSGTAPAYVRDDLSAAMTAAQNFGRMTVLQAAPPGHYYASELLDKNTCKPCRAVDGKEFQSLDQADAAYPAGGYVSCSGGGRCRGELITVWDSSATASAVPQAGEETMTDVQLGGKPNKGTKKDKRLHENDMAAEDDHFGSASGSVSDAPWDGAASRFSDEQYQRAAAACDSGDGSPKERCFLPHHEPGGATNRNGVHAAAQRVSSLKGHDPAAVARAKAHLRSHYSQMGEDVPDSIKATIGDEVELAMEAARIESAEDFAAQDAGATEGATAPWKGPLAIEGKVTGDGREFAKGALTWPDNPAPGEMALRWNKEDSHGGEPHTVAVNVGRIDRVYREGDLIMGEGVFDLGHPDGREAHRRVGDGFLRGISIDADSISDADVEFVWPEGANGDAEDGEPDLFEMLFAQPEKIVFHGGRIRAATLCDIPAFAEAYIALTDPEGAVVAGGQTHPEDVPERKAAPERPVDGLVASGGPRDDGWLPPADWFADPQLSVPTGITVTDEGRVYGHAAMWGSCHIGQPDVCVQPPREDSHPYFMTGEVATREGGRVPVGQITVGTGHAALHLGAVPATEHYDHTGHAVADVSVGNDAHGIWVAGSIRPGADPLLVHELRASGQVSGDWRRIGSALRMVGLLAVNIPGFPVPKLKARVASGVQEALVAAGRPTIAHGKSEQEQIQQAFRTVMDMLFQRVHEGE